MAIHINSGLLQQRGTTFTNNNTSAATGTFPLSSNGAKTAITKSMLNGLWIVDYGTTATRSSTFGTNSILNVGSVNNEGIIELGQ